MTADTSLVATTALAGAWGRANAGVASSTTSPTSSPPAFERQCSDDTRKGRQRP
jgi:hypothetical protein